MSIIPPLDVGRITVDYRHFQFEEIYTLDVEFIFIGKLCAVYFIKRSRIPLFFHEQYRIVFKGTVSRDFRPSVFFIK
jgi:hypothetical protein